MPLACALKRLLLSLSRITYPAASPSSCALATHGPVCGILIRYTTMVFEIRTLPHCAFRRWIIAVAMLSFPAVLGAQQPAPAAPDYSAPPGAPYTAENVVVSTAAGHVLAGTLTVPAGASRSRPVPAIVTITGSTIVHAQNGDAAPGERVRELTKRPIVAEPEILVAILRPRSGDGHDSRDALGP